MHELSLCQNILEIVEQQCKTHNIRKVTDVWLEIGSLSCVEHDALKFCFDVVCQGTSAEKCQLHLIPIAAKAWCWQCETLVEIQSHQDACPQCGGINLQRQSGDELRIKEIAFE
ncbi:hydrogenase maturation nickel metallochaperone HypA [Rodentibacter trehalosifermentans]|uniref:Hydrogenase maturation factor HypA n=1 Tax=Rodentibacter trehalosifermentans TaxID=1908263 RepID=A0A1V3ISM9_9PAST|nr:hydrogenase maturation nickel metallochaperone HypA [Rodentibacter trehalosifermentans]OOF45288.1 hydrogenase maturation nickel metallochaperone HypA [Rodentibacter trehalosifermentans]OOF53151.1 hydrogenase maturation nickel metallochaperone HypA [Rodentibacter trehalosifermentans]